MIYLILAIMSSALVSITMRLSEKSVKNNIALLSVNYIVCLCMASVYTGFNNIYVSIEGMNKTVLLGVVNGVLYLTSFVLFQRSIKKNGVILSSLFMKLGILIPIIISILIFKEIPDFLQMIGFIIAVIAIIFMNYQKDNDNSFNYSLVILLIANGMTDAMSKIYEEVGNSLLSEQFLFYTFLFALILCLILTYIKKQKITINEIKYGLIIGIPNYFSARFLLLALQSLSAVIVYPTFSVGTVIVVAITGMIFFNEKISQRQKVALMAILLSLILLNL